MDTPWIEVSGKKRNRNSPEMSTLRKQSKMNRYQLSKPIPTTNFEGFKEEFDDENNNIKYKRQLNPHPSLLLVESIIFHRYLLKETIKGNRY